jgi:hypothetical protein
MSQRNEQRGLVLSEQAMDASFSQPVVTDEGSEDGCLLGYGTM